MISLFTTKKIRIIGTRPYPLSGNSSKVRINGKRRYEVKSAKVVGVDGDYPYWKERGWRKVRKGYKGEYKTEYGRWNGFIQENFLGSHSFYIFDLPETVKKSNHGDCFTYKGGGKYSIHFSKKPADISSGILTIERLIAESMGNDRKGGIKWLSLGAEKIREYL
jgi:hypothetical protein